MEGTIRKIVDFVTFCKKNKDDDEEKIKEKKTNKNKKATNIFGKKFYS